MKKNILIAWFIWFLSFPYVFAELDDDSILKELSVANTKEVSAETLMLKSFNSCDDLEKVTSNFLKDYNKKYWNQYARDFFMEDDMVFETTADVSESISQKSANVVSGSAGKDFSSTNEQVSWVSESEIIKTDWKYIYYMSDYYDNTLKTQNYQERQKKNVYIIDAENMKVVKKINLPKHFWGTQLYLQNDRLVILASGSPSSKFQSQFWDNSSKTYTIIYDVSDPVQAKMLKAFMSEWNFEKSRLIDNKLYVISRKNTYSYFRAYQDDISLEAEKIIPKGLEIVATTNKDKKNVEINGEIRDYNVTSGYVAKCSDVDYILPDTSADLWYPQFNMISIIDIEDMTNSADTKLIFGNLNEIYMSLDNLYLTNNVYKTDAFRCAPNMRCIAPFYYGGTNHTLVHKMNISKTGLNYQTSALLEWSPLTQYSMDEYKWDFRILTKANSWNFSWEQAHTDLYILDNNLELKSSLQNLGLWEDFKSSRYIWDKLFLVTFEQIDPLFVIDLADAKNPKILWELKMPGYSTYLHPYDENHIIGIGYDTIENKWWGIQNAGVKIDLYEVNYDKTCSSSWLSQEEVKKCSSGDYKWILVKQKYTKTFGGYGSDSEALNNPRMFMWKANEKTLLLPVTLKQSSLDDQYRSIDFFQWLVSLKIDKDTGIAEQYKITHLDMRSIEEERKIECEKYTPKEEKEVCVELIGGGQYCTDPNKTSAYVPKYCYADSPIWEYLAAQSWNYSKYFIKRALWVDNTVYTLSDSQVMSSNLKTGEYYNSVDMK